MYLFIIAYKISYVLFGILIKKALSSQCERKKGDIFKSYPFTGANVNAPKRVVKCWDKKRALTRQC